MSFNMELRSRRSKSKTPVSQTVIEKQSQVIGNHVSLSKTITKTSSTKATYSDIDTSEIMDNTTNNIEESRKFLNLEVSQPKSSFQNNEVSSTNHQNLSNESFDDSLNSFSSTGSSVSALDVYRAAGEYWNKFPKTDYTYSVHSKDRKELAPGIVAMPNMSRRSLHSYIKSGEYYFATNRSSSGQSFNQDQVDNSTKTNSWLASAAMVQPRTSFTNNNYESSYKSSAVSTKTSLFRRFLTVFKNVMVTILTFFYVTYTIQNSMFMWVGKKIHKATTRVMLWDTRLLQSRTPRQNKLNSILALCFIPLLILTGWWLFNGLGSVLYGTDYATTQTVSNTPIKIAHDSAYQDATTTLTFEKLQEITKLLENPFIQGILNDRSADVLNREDEHFIAGLKADILKIQLDLQNLENARNIAMDNLATQLRSEATEKIAHLTYQLNRCCRSSYIQTEKYVTRIVKDFLGAPTYLATPQDISKWLHSTFVAKHDLEMHTNNLTQHLQSDYSMLIENNGKFIMDTVMSKILLELNSRIDRIQKHEIVGELSVDSLTDEYIKKIVQNTLAIYDADKTGLVDYALESAGGQILSTRCTESYHARTAVFSIFGIPLWYLGNTPRTVIMPGVTPGECWAFQNFPGFVVIKLAASVKIEAFSLEHVSKLLAPNGKIDSAPKEFFVYGLRNETDKEPVLLGHYKYDADGPPLQYFAAQAHGLVFDIIELRIHSNHGNPNYTCLYRFRVHGILSNEPT